VNDGLVVVRPTLVSADATAVLVDPSKRALDYPNPGPHVKSARAGDPSDDLNLQGKNAFRPAEQSTRVAAVAQISWIVEKPPRSPASSRCAASRSWIEAAVTTTVSSSPLTSTAMCQLDPIRSLPAVPSATGSGHRVGCGHGLRVDDRRGQAPVSSGPHAESARSASWMRCHTPARTQRTKIPGKSVRVKRPIPACLRGVAA